MTTIHKMVTFFLYFVGLYYLSLIIIVSMCTCTSSIFVTLETYAVHHPDTIPLFLRWLSFEWPCFKKSQKGDYTQIEIKPAQSPELLPNEIHPFHRAHSQPANNSQETQVKLEICVVFPFNPCRISYWQLTVEKLHYICYETKFQFLGLIFCQWKTNIVR